MYDICTLYNIYNISLHNICILPCMISVICNIAIRAEVSEYFFQDRIRIRIYSLRQFLSEYEYEYIRIAEKIFEYIRIFKYIRIFEYIRIFPLKFNTPFA